VNAHPGRPGHQLQGVWGGLRLGIRSLARQANSWARCGSSRSWRSHRRSVRL